MDDSLSFFTEVKCKETLKSHHIREETKKKSPSNQAKIWVENWVPAPPLVPTALA